MTDKKHQDILLSQIKSDNDRKTLRDLFACVNSRNNDTNSKAKEITSGLNSIRTIL